MSVNVMANTSNKRTNKDEQEQERDHDDLVRLASNNPAMTLPASSALSSSSRNYRRPLAAETGKVRRQQQQQQQQQQQELTSWSTSSTDHTTVVASDPAGDIITDATATAIDEEEEGEEEKSKYDRGWRRVVRNFSPSWFSTTMGTGIVSLLFITIPFPARWLYWLAVTFFVLNALLFVMAFAVSLLRYALYPDIWTVMVRDPTNSLFLGTVPMGFATLVEAWVFLCCPYWGPWAVEVAWGCWIVDALAAGAVTVSLMFLLISEEHQQQLDRITAAQLLPIAATIVAAGTGVEVAEKLNGLGQYERTLGTLLAGYVMWGMAVPFALTVLVMYYQRLALHKLPPREVVVSSFLPLGPLGMGGYTIFYAGKVARQVLPHVGLLGHVPVAADVLYVLGLMVALVMWGFGLVWLCFALATIWSSRPFPFNMGWWGFTFPLGVFAVSTITFGTELPSRFFRVLGTVFSVAVILLWCVCAAGTAKGAWSGKLFYAPCLKNLRKVEEEKHPRAEVDLENGKTGNSRP